MSNMLVFNVLPFDPMIVPNRYVRLPIDVEDLANKLREKFPDGEVQINQKNEETDLVLYIKTEEYGVWAIVVFDGGISNFTVKGWPKHIAKELVYWYRRYIPLSYPLFIAIPAKGYVSELTANTSLDDIEKMYTSSSL